MKFKKKVMFFICVIIFCVGIIMCPQVCLNGVKKGLLMCSDVVIPSLFPFSVCTLIIFRLNIFENLKFLNKISLTIFKRPINYLATMLLSMIGGYPVGAQLINEQIKSDDIYEKEAQIMLFYCINAGPAFIVIAIGNGILNSQKIGYLLLLSHILSSFIIAIIINRIFEYKTTANTQNKTSNMNFSDCFVLSVSDSAQNMIKISSFIVAFSVVNSYIDLLSNKLSIIKGLLYLTEVTCAVSNTDNVLLISCILGFSGFCICCQVLSILGKYNISVGILIVGRLSHSFLSLILTYFSLKIFNLPIQTISNNLKLYTTNTNSGFEISISLFMMSVLLIISIFSKKHGGKNENNMI